MSVVSLAECAHFTVSVTMAMVMSFFLWLHLSEESKNQTTWKQKHEPDEDIKDQNC